MTEAERQEQKLNRLWRAAVNVGPPNQYGSISTQTDPIKRGSVYSLAQVQLNDGSVVGMTISASPSLGQHLVKEMGSTGYLYIFNDTESLMIKADRVVAVKLTKMTT